MSRVNFMNCPCWDPWKIGCKRLKKAKPGTLAQMTKSYPVSAGVKDQLKSRSSLKFPGPPATKFVPRSSKILLRSREPQDISKDFSELSPDFLLSHAKGRHFFTLREESSDTKRPADTSFSKPILPSTPPKLQTEDIVADLVEQISELTGIMEQLCRDHETTHKQLENEMEEKCNELHKEHESKVRQIETLHKAEIESLEEQYKKELRMERATAQEKMSGMQKEYKYLKNAFRVYQDSISDEMEEKWLRRQAEWKKSERTEREKALLQQKQSLTRKFEMQIEEHQKMIQKDSFLLGKAYHDEKQDFLNQHEEDLERINTLMKKIDTLEEELKEKNETLNSIASTLHNTEMELQHEKAAAAVTEKTVLQRIAVIEEKHRIHMNSLVEENVALRRKLLERNEEILSERSQRSDIF
ncbi:flagellum-associated coiled-coil domain-containing protein 1 [Heteronotia binoei]|uniref:flagellum-associated coiled-coil domain-containing protein 1 n=1 Tax=Heteronotia binoei TaxID=13085 RepID=UPI00292EB35C|nr:flagellum-associated coiled-coil domain-containing protein 1 [Heteronotia binoei]